MATNESCTVQSREAWIHFAKFFYPLTFHLLPAASSSVLARGYESFRDTLLSWISGHGPSSSAVARQALQGRHRQGDPNYKSMSTLIKRMTILIFVTMLPAVVSIGCNTAHGFGKDVQSAGQGIQNGTK
jgi:predicted small secreted protein